jgi:hypothetical protein
VDFSDCVVLITGGAHLATVARIYVRIGDFLRAETRLRRLLDELRLPRDVRDGVLRCADGIATWLVANHAWHRRTSRYPSGGPCRRS